MWHLPCPKSSKSRIIHALMLLLCPPLMAQTAQVPPAPVTGTAQIQGQSASCKIPRNGGTCTFTFPAYNAQVTGTTAQTKAPVSLSGLTGTFTCTLAPDSTVITNPDGTKTITGVVCSVVTK